MVFPQLPQRMSPCRVTFTPTDVKRQYGRVIVGTDRTTHSNLSGRPGLGLEARGGLQSHSFR